MAEEIYHVIIVEADGEIIIAKHTKKELIAWLGMRMDEITHFVDTLSDVEAPLEWLENSDYLEGSAILILKGGKVVVPDITKKIDYKCDIE